VVIAVAVLFSATRDRREIRPEDLDPEAFRED